MKPTLALLLTFVLLAAAPAAFAADWVALLDGADIKKHWTTTGNWSLKDGIATLTPRPGEQGWKRFDAYLWSKKTHGDFEIEVDLTKGVLGQRPKTGNIGFQDNGMPLSLRNLRVRELR